MNAGIQRRSPLTDLKEGKNELDLQFFFSFGILDLCGAGYVKEIPVKSKNIPCLNVS